MSKKSKHDYYYLNDILEGFVPGEIQKMNIVGARTTEINTIVKKGFAPLTPTAKLTIVELRLTSISAQLEKLIAKYDKLREVDPKSDLECIKESIDKLIKL